MLFNSLSKWVSSPCTRHFLYRYHFVYFLLSLRQIKYYIKSFLFTCQRWNLAGIGFNWMNQIIFDYDFTNLVEHNCRISLHDGISCGILWFVHWNLAGSWRCAYILQSIIVIYSTVWIAINYRIENWNNVQLLYCMFPNLIQSNPIENVWAWTYQYFSSLRNMLHMYYTLKNWNRWKKLNHQTLSFLKIHFPNTFSTQNSNFLHRTLCYSSQETHWIVKKNKAN